MSVLRLPGRRLDTGEQGFRTIVDDHGAAVRSYLRRRTPDPSRAEDLTQEVFLRAWRQADRYDPGRASLRGWLLAIARNLAIDNGRAAAARPQTVSAEAQLAAVPAPDVLDGAVEAWTMAQALRELAPHHRDVLVCLYYRCWTMVETADHLDVPLGTVKSRSTYALRAMREILEKTELQHEH